MIRAIRSGAFKIAFIYTIIGILWIGLSDRVLHGMQESLGSSLVYFIGSIKAFAYVLITGVILYKLILIHEHKLLQNERQYRRYFEDNPSPMWIYNRETLQFIAVNNAAVVHYGYSREEFTKMSILDIRPAEQAPRVQEAVRTLQTDYHYSGVWVHQKKDGTQMHVQIASHLINSGNKQNVMVLATDITQLKKVEDERNDYLLKLEDTLNSISDAFFTIDRDWNIRSVNTMYETISGFKREDVINKNILELWPHVRDSTYYEKYNKVLSEHVTVKFEDYSTIFQKWLQIACYPTNEGMAVYFTDITESKQKDILLQQALERYDLAAYATQDMLYEFNIAENKLSYSQSYGHFSGIDMTNEEDPSTAWMSLVHPDDVQKLTAAMGKTLEETASKYACEYRVDCGSKNYRHVYDQASIIYNDEQQPLRMIGAVRDISDLKEKEASLLRQNTILREIAWEESHDVRRPLASILSLIDLVKTSTDETEKQELFNFIDISAKELDIMICKINQKIDEVTE